MDSIEYMQSIFSNVLHVFCFRAVFELDLMVITGSFTPQQRKEMKKEIVCTDSHLELYTWVGI